MEQTNKKFSYIETEKHKEKKHKANILVIEEVYINL